MWNRSLTAVNLTRDCQFNYIEFIGQIYIFRQFPTLCCNCFNPFSRRTSFLSQHQQREVLTCWVPRPVGRMRHALLSTQRGGCQPRVSSLFTTWHFICPNRGTSLRSNCILWQTKLTYLKWHTHTHTHTLVLAHPLCSHAHPLATHSGHTVRPYQSHYKFNVRPFCAASARPQFQ